ncbi:hypothetical protein [Flavivirga sp. 57AJ16]|uniref:hypothetical protein n=1 Tax=Flavivirga sp. 57AJ16 TaxID=3025307 RepID=UPI0023669E61|nr:hypothetical protein [Flavivirga sp. 57AJ16]MDD7887865.1 hypothetical protein [Flavivirga sp. 57AJ16]
MSTESQYYRYNPEKRNVFIEIHKGRTNHVSEFVLGFFMMFASHASAIIEVFLRKRFGERYITLAQSIGLFLILNISYSWLDNLFRLRINGAGIVLFIFSCAYLGFSIYHRMEIKKYGTTYDFKRFSLSDGELNTFWVKILGKIFRGMKVSNYTIHVLIEPAIPVLIGIIFVLIPITRVVGMILIFCGIIYGLRNLSKAQQGRNWVLDNIDKKICSEMKYDVFIGRKPKQDTKGVYLPIELPDDEGMRKSLYNLVEDSFQTTKDIWDNDFLDGKGDQDHG